MERRDWALLVTGLPEGSALTPVQLQKSLFLLHELLPVAQQDEGFYTFVPYNYGPFSAEIYSDAEELERMGLMEISISTRGGWREYAATAEGRARAQEIARALPAGVGDYVMRVVNWVRSLSFNDLVSFIYKRWPEYRVNSIFTSLDL